MSHGAQAGNPAIVTVPHGITECSEQLVTIHPSVKLTSSLDPSTLDQKPKPASPFRSRCLSPAATDERMFQP